MTNLSCASGARGELKLTDARNLNPMTQTMRTERASRMYVENKHCGELRLSTAPIVKRFRRHTFCEERTFESILRPSSAFVMSPPELNLKRSRTLPSMKSTLT